MKSYYVSVVCSDATTISNTVSAKSRAEANGFCNGIKFMLTKQGKSIYMESIKLKN